MKNRRALFTLVATCFVLLGFTRVETSAQSGQPFQGSDLEQFLTRAKITGMKDIPEGVTLPRKATLEIDGAKHFGVFKTIDEGPVPSKVLDRGVELQFIDWQNQAAKIRLFDNLIYNTDRHLDNLLITDDWKIRLIDHSRTFRPFEQLKDPKALATFSRSLLAKLETLNEPLLKEHVGKYLTEYQIQGLLKRRDAIIALSKKLVEEKGAGAVLYQ